MKLLKCLSGVAVLILVCVGALAAELALPPGVVKPVFFDKQGIKVVGYQKGVAGFNVWQVEKGSVKTVFYTSADNKILMSGVLWDAATGANISDQYIPDKVVASAAPSPVPQAVAGGFSHDKASEAIIGVSKLVGIKEGRGAIDKTLYIIFDPRCTHCDAVYKNTRDYVRRGGSIKWIPTTVLGDVANGAALIAGILEARDPVTALAAAMGKSVGGKSPSQATSKAIADNEAYFFAAFERNKNAGAAGVPVAFFEKQDGSPQMVGSIDDDVLLPKILNDVKH